MAPTITPSRETVLGAKSHPEADIDLVARARTPAVAVGIIEIDGRGIEANLPALVDFAGGCEQRSAEQAEEQTTQPVIELAEKVKEDGTAQKEEVSSNPDFNSKKGNSTFSVP